MRRHALALVVLLAPAGCAPVPAWERGILAHPCMAPDDHPERDRAREHMLGAREATRGAGSSRTGGGCGCN